MHQYTEKNCNFIAIATFAPEIALNLGNIMRTSVCFALPLHVIEPCGFPFSLKSVKRSAMDYADSAEIYHHLDWKTFMADSQGRKVLLTTKTNQSYTDFAFEKGDILILGQESAGVPDSVRNDCDEMIKIPMPGGGRSLNVATAMAIVSAEAVRQIKLKDK